MTVNVIVAGADVATVLLIVKVTTAMPAKVAVGVKVRKKWPPEEVIEVVPADDGDSEITFALTNGPPVAPVVRSTVAEMPDKVAEVVEAAVTGGTVTVRLKVFDEVRAVGVVWSVTVTVKVPPMRRSPETNSP